MVTIIILSALLLITSGLMVFYAIKWYRVKTLILSDNRVGFYEYISTYYGNVYVYVEEVERYTNGKSRLKLKKLEYVGSGSDWERESIIKKVREGFNSLKNTADVDWLEVERSLKDIRLEKLKRINKFKK